MILNNININKYNYTKLKKRIDNGYFKTINFSFDKQLKKLKNSISNKDKNTIKNMLLICLYQDSSKTITYIRKHGLLRFSNFINNFDFPLYLINLIKQEQSQYFTLKENELEYLETLSNFHFVTNSYNELEKSIDNLLNIFEQKNPTYSLNKTLLIYAEYHIIKYHYSTNNGILININTRSSEEIISAISYLVYYISSKRPFRKNLSQVPDVTFFQNDIFIKTIENVCNFLDCREFEIEIDCFNYKCKKDKNTLELSPPDKNIEKSIRLGYIKYTIQSFNKINIETLKNLNFEIFIKNLFTEFEQHTDNPISLSKHDIFSRDVLQIPTSIYEIIDKQSKDHLWNEEIVYLDYILDDISLDHIELKNFAITSNLNLMDIIKIRRFFLAISLLYKYFIYEKQDNQIIFLNSLTPVLSKDLIINLLFPYFTPHQIEDFIGIFSWDQNKKGILDLQYTPFIKLNINYHLCLNIFYYSNYVRNLIASERKRNNQLLNPNGDNDPITDKLIETFKSQGIDCWSNINIANAEIDVIALIDDTMYIFECKNSLHPTSIFDIMTTYDYILKAEKQLNNIVSINDNNNLLPQLELKLDYNFKFVKSIYPSIILGNRLFNGNSFNYPIRYINEVTNFFRHGTIRTKDGSFRMWETTKLKNLDVLKYFSKQNDIFKIFDNSLQSHRKEFNFYNTKITKPTYYIDSSQIESKIEKYCSTLAKVDHTN